MSKKSIVERYKPVFTERVADQIWKAASERPLLGGEILDMIYGNSPDRPDTAHEAIRQLDKTYYVKKYGRGLMSTTAYRPENYEDEKAKRRG